MEGGKGMEKERGEEKRERDGYKGRERREGEGERERGREREPWSPDSGV